MAGEGVNLHEHENMLVWVLSEGRSASIDYYIGPWLTRHGYACELIDTRYAPSLELLAGSPSRVIVSRYLPTAWVGALEKFSAKGIELVYFMDDDLFDWHVLAGLPWRYRWRLIRKAIMQYKKVRRLCDEFWVSTPYLAEKYAHLNPQLISPALTSMSLHTIPLVRICYHGTASHPEEIIWLRDVMAEVQSLCENCHFEIFGDAKVKKMYCAIPRVSVMHAMSWPDYLSWSSSEKRDIALAPLMAGQFNAARGPTKFFDYTRMQAAGIYSNVAPYQGFIRHGVDGLLLENESKRWVEAIMGLVSEPEKRNAIMNESSKRIEALAKD